MKPAQENPVEQMVISVQCVNEDVEELEVPRSDDFVL